MAKIKWTKDDVIKKFQEAMTSPGPETGQRPKLLQNLLDRAKTKITRKPTEGEEETV